MLYVPRHFGAISHIEVRSVKPARAPLPITETGYRSHFVPLGTVEAHGGDVVAQVRAWLDEAALDKAWIERCERARQGELAL